MNTSSEFNSTETETGSASDATQVGRRDQDPSNAVEEFENYRALSKAAVLSAACAFLGLLSSCLNPFALVVFTLLGVLSGLVALRNLRRYRSELSGRGLAAAGTIFSALLLVGGSSFYSYVYVTEVPEGYQRVNWFELQGEQARPMSPYAGEINNKPIFIKGYVHPGVDGFGEIKSFVLVPDMKTCCFGGQPKPWDMIEITLAEDCGKIKYSTRKRKLWGVFKVGPGATKQIGKVRPGFYKMTADDFR